jgi:hypothetical protein
LRCGNSVLNLLRQEALQVSLRFILVDEPESEGYGEYLKRFEPKEEN